MGNCKSSNGKNNTNTGITYIKVEPKVGKSMDFMSIVSNIELLDIIMNDNELNNLFEAYLKGTFQYENLEFFKKIEDTQKITNIEDRENELKTIYKKFIKKGASNEINISDLTSSQFNNNKNSIKPYVEAKKIILGLMVTNALPGFVAQMKDMPDVFTNINSPKYIISNPFEWVLSLIPIAESLPICVTVSDYDRENKLIYVNQQFVHITGYSRVYATNRNCKFLQGPDTEKESITSMKNAFEKKEKVEVKITNYTRDSKKFVNFLYLRPIFMTNKKNKVKFYLGFQIDINKQNIEIVDKVVNTFPEYIYQTN